MMLHLNWRNSEDYRFTTQFNAGQWAWEFLRRNTAYQADWTWFYSTWQRLEARYGKPPARDFQVWQQDSDAYRLVDDDKLLIECWMGSQWGFYKFPLDPRTDQPCIGEQLSWRPLAEAICVVDKACFDAADGDRPRLALDFELDMPLRPQVEAAQQFLQRRQAYLRKRAGMPMRSVATLSTDWTLMLRFLDGRGAGETLESMQPVLGDSISLPQADTLIRGGYRDMAFLPEARG